MFRFFVENYCFNILPGSLRNCHIISIPVTMVAITSDDGKENHTPSNLKKCGSVNSRGIKNITCRVRLRNIDLPAIPRDWKKLVATIWNPTIQNINVLIFNPWAVASISVWSFVNARAIHSGKSEAVMVPSEHIIVAVKVDSRNARFMRSKRFNP